MSLPRPVRVIGCGSPYGDDALAWEVVRRLRAANPLPDAELHCAARGDCILDLLDGRGSLILIDAIRSGCPPGTIRRIVWPDRRIELLRPPSTHLVRPADALQLAATVGILPARVVIFGVEANCVTPTAGLSHEIQRQIPRLIKRVIREAL